jgi:hypothetical protein
MPLTQVQSAMLGNSGAELGMRNRIINGDMRIDQRNAGASVTPTSTNTYTLDRWSTLLSQASKFSVQQNAASVTPPVGFSKYLGFTSASAYSVLTGDYFASVQYIEGNNVADLAWGTADAQTVTLSFWVRSSLTGTFGGALRNGAGTRSYPFTYTINSANTWEKETITIAGDTSGTWASDNTAAIGVQFGLGVGATYSGTAGAWAGTLYLSATGATSVVGTNGATFYITGVQLEKGVTATSFDYRPYGTELALCQRYCVQWSGSGVPYLIGQTNTAANCYSTIPFAMRATPTSSFLSVSVNDSTVSNPVSAISGFTMNGSGGAFIAVSSGLTLGRAGMVLGSGSTSYLRFDAEL